MSKKYICTSVVFLLMLFSLTTYSRAGIVYQNDFGTVDQRTIGGTGDWDVLRPESTIDFSNLYVWPNGWWFNSIDLDGDTIHTGIQAGNGTAGEMWVWKQITADPGYVLNNIVVTVNGWGNGQLNRFSAALSDQADFAGTFVQQYWWQATPLAGGGYNVVPATASGGADPAFTGVSSVWIGFSVASPSTSISTSNGYVADVTVTADVNVAPPTVLPNPIYTNDFGTSAQRTVGGGGDWDSSVTLHGSPVLDFYDGGLDGISADMDSDANHGGLAANGNMGVRYIKHITLAEGQTMRDIEILARGHASADVNSSISVGVSLDGATWDHSTTVSGYVSPYPDKEVYASTSGDVNYINLTEAYIMIEWYNQEATTDPNLAAYITDVSISATVTDRVVLDATDWGLYGGDFSMDTDWGTASMGIYPGGGADTLYFNSVAGRQSFWDYVVHIPRTSGRPRFVLLWTKGTIQQRKDQLDTVFDTAGGVETYLNDLAGIYFSEESDGTDDANENELYDYVKANWPLVQVYKWYSAPIRPRSIWTGGIAEKCDGYLYDYYGPDNYRQMVMKHVITGKPFANLVFASDPNVGYLFQCDWVPGKTWDLQDGMVTNSPNSCLEQYFWMASDALREFGQPVGLFGVGHAGSVNAWLGGNDSPNNNYIVTQLAFPLRLEMRHSSGGALPSADYGFSDGMDVNTAGAYSYTDDYKTNGIFVGLGTIDEATIIGFTNLLQTDNASGELVTRRKAGGSGQVELIYRFHAATGGIGSVSASLDCSVVPAQNGVTKLGLSYNGRDITDYDQTTAVGSPQTLNVSGGGAYTDREAFYVHVIMSFDNAPANNPANSITELRVSATHDSGATPVPEDLKCATGIYPDSDVTGLMGVGYPDCFVDFADFTAIAAVWMDCTDPNDPVSCQ